MTYKGQPYWETEAPQKVAAGPTEFRWYPKAGKLQVHDTFVDPDGVRKTRKVVTVSAEALSLSPEAVALLRQVLDDAEAHAGAGSSRGRVQDARRPSGAQGARAAVGGAR